VSWLILLCILLETVGALLDQPKPPRRRKGRVR
jgi:hypothetical protein